MVNRKEMLSRMGLTQQDDEIEYVRNGCGHPIHFEGKNGKLRAVPRGFPYQGNRENYEALSAVCCGYPHLSELAQKAFDVIYPVIDAHEDRDRETQHDMLDAIALEDESFHHKSIPQNSQAYGLAYTIAERLVEQGIVK